LHPFRLIICLSSCCLVLKSLIAASATAFGAYLAYRFYSIPRSVRPGINAPFADESKQADEFVDRFETESREIFNKSVSQHNTRKM
jgi:hypothetical protein